MSGLDAPEGYELIRALGHHGTSYEAADPGGRTVVLRHLDAPADVVARAAALLGSSDLVIDGGDGALCVRQVLAGTSGSWSELAPYVGESLADRILRAPVPHAMLDRIVERVERLLERARAAGVEPVLLRASNVILVQERDQTLSVKVVDWLPAGWQEGPPCAEQLAQLRAEVSCPRASDRELDAGPLYASGEIDPLVGSTLAGRYRLLRLLRRGGMGTVYEAAVEDGPRVAVKLLDPALAGRRPAARRRMFREAAAAVALEHANVVRLFGTESDPTLDLPFLVMELLTGVDLAALIRAFGPLRHEAVARLFVQACNGLEAAHARGLVHRDVTPANLFVCREPDGTRRLKVCDFGLAKLHAPGLARNASELTQSGGVLGSPMYMAPEQARDAREVDARTDVWGLGSSLYHALCGVPPWQGRTTVGELILAVCTEELPHVQDRAPWLPRGLARVVHRALARQPDARWASARAFADALEPFACEERALGELLSSVPATVRQRAAPRAEPIASLTLDSPAVASSPDERAQPQRGRPARRISAVVVAIAVALSAGWLLRGVGATAATTPSAVAPVPAAAARVRVRIEPRDARVLVDGMPHAVRDGALWLEGEPGSTFDVVVRDGERSLQAMVAIGRTGEAVPDVLVVEPERRIDGPREATVTAPVPAPARAVVHARATDDASAVPSSEPAREASPARQALPITPALSASAAGPALAPVEAWP